MRFHERLASKHRQQKECEQFIQDMAIVLLFLPVVWLCVCVFLA